MILGWLWGSGFSKKPIFSETTNQPCAYLHPPLEKWTAETLKVGGTAIIFATRQLRPLSLAHIDNLLFRLYDLGAISVVAAATAIWWTRLLQDGFPS